MNADGVERDRDEKPPVELQPPGAGLPFLELQLSRAALAVLFRFTSREAASAKFRQEADRVLGLVRSLEPQAAARRVLIPRPWGIEDSSRFWSGYMVLEHLTIVDREILNVIQHLAAGRRYERIITIRNVKPAPGQDSGAVERFAAAADGYLAAVAALGEFPREGTYPHPWFGPKNAHWWHCLAGTHHALHARQLERIIRVSRES